MPRQETIDAMPLWTAFPHAADGFQFDAEALRARWPDLHAGDVEPWPDDPAVLAAWQHFHAGRFQAAVEAGRAAGDPGANAADRAQLAQAYFLEGREAARAELFEDVAARAGERAARRPDDPNAHHLQALAMARRAQGVNIGRALALGLLGRIRSALEAAIALAPGHAHAHVALGSFHAEVIDKLGALIGRTQGVSKDQGLAMFRTALKLDPASVLARVEFANGLLMLEGDQRLDEATRLYHEAAALAPRDATERLEVEMARHALRE